eukprot:1159873-Pelagomonas_calceolata.AAC.17
MEEHSLGAGITNETNKGGECQGCCSGEALRRGFLFHTTVDNGIASCRAVTFQVEVDKQLCFGQVR